MSTVYHVSIRKTLLIEAIRRFGVRAVFLAWAPSDHDAIALLERDHREWLPLEPTCDHRGADGQCIGHAQPERT